MVRTCLSKIGRCIVSSDMVTVDGSSKVRGTPKLTSEAVIQNRFLGYQGTRCSRLSSMEKTNTCRRPQFIGT